MLHDVEQMEKYCILSLTTKGNAYNRRFVRDSRQLQRTDPWTCMISSIDTFPMTSGWDFQPNKNLSF